jgi:hypothetical protein
MAYCLPATARMTAEALAARAKPIPQVREEHFRRFNVIDESAIPCRRHLSKQV